MLLFLPMQFIWSRIVLDAGNDAGNTARNYDKPSREPFGFVQTHNAHRWALGSWELGLRDRSAQFIEEFIWRHDIRDDVARNGQRDLPDCRDIIVTRWEQLLDQLRNIHGHQRRQPLIKQIEAID